MKHFKNLKAILCLLFVITTFSVAVAQSSQATLALYDLRWVTGSSSLAVENKLVPFGPDSGAVGVKESVLFMTEGLRQLSCPSAGGYIRATGWDLASSDLYWIMTNLNTSDYFSLSLSSQQNYSTGGPTDFKIQYRIGSEDNPWTDVPNGTKNIATTESWTAGTIANLPLPAECAGKPSVAIRWLYLPLLAITPAATGGQGRIDNIKVKGYQNTTSPILYDTYSNIDFGVLGVDSTKIITINLLGKNLTGSLTAATIAPFVVQSQSITQSFGQINKTFTLSFHPTAEGVFSQSFTISGGGITSKTITLTGKTRNLTAVENLNSEMNYVYSLDGMLKIDLPQSSKVVIFDTVGHKVSEKQLQSGLNSILLPRNQVYLIKIENKVKKIVL